MLTSRTALISPIIRLNAQLAAIRAHRLLERHELERFSERSREPIEWLAGNSRVNRRKSRRYMVRLVCATVLMTLMASAPAAASSLEWKPSLIPARSHRKPTIRISARQSLVAFWAPGPCSRIDGSSRLSSHFHDLTTRRSVSSRLYRLRRYHLRTIRRRRGRCRSGGRLVGRRWWGSARTSMRACTSHFSQG